jgi:peroxiredoxin family protein
LLEELDKDVPLAFVAVAVNVYAVPSVSPVNVYGDDVAVFVVVDGLEVIDHEVMADPPVAPVNVNIADWPAEDALILGACGTVVAVTADDAEDVADEYEFEAATVYVYDVLD